MNSDRRTFLAGVAAAALLAGCFNEQLPEQNLSGTIVVPAELIEDSREIGMAYLGVFESWDPEQLGYSYPATGPRVGDNPLGDTQPYGGTTVGEYAYPCMRALRCNIITGRYTTIDDLLEANPVTTESGDLMTSEEFYDQCQWYYGWNLVDEFTFLGDSVDFQKNDDGDWEAEFLAFHTQIPAGSVLWGFVDNDFTSCSIDQGSYNRRSSDDGQFFREGSNFPDILNFPDKYITDGDLVSSQVTTIVAEQTDGYELRLDQILD